LPYSRFVLSELRRERNLKHVIPRPPFFDLIADDGRSGVDETGSRSGRKIGVIEDVSVGWDDFLSAGVRKKDGIGGTGGGGERI
jgi:hypothetical protein